MYIIVNKDNNIFIASGETLDYMDNGYPILVNENIAFATEIVNVYEVKKIPESVSYIKYCYTPEQGFYLNPDWQEPNKYGISNNLLAQIEQDYRDKLAEEVAEE